MITLYDDYLRTIVDIPKRDIQALDILCESEHMSRAEAIRRAVTIYLKQHQSQEDEAFGLWRKRNLDAMSYQDNLRDEWTPVLHEPRAS